ncbi:MAG: hypothetical protein F4201_10115 [Nitrospira sp. SB0677_bin_15]|nr:hypothetical protein [Nitrospira sp. SB0667_bin_9]MYD29996.1 hypothetical protein [Nitrospira sp. SB0661_bin_20]MYG41148.1 hypothetical protein [Nitrospira sp. SB0677_bin_15]MYH02184.1 hypothetical protein [Nitrospira sp. SB0675_bin_23]MYJ23336.1 hypothetical protein [Nitrospira sp. SB0673_bin_12]
MNNAIALARKLEREHGFNQPQAEGIAQAIHEHESEHLATKADLAKLEATTKADLAKLEATTKADLAKLEANLAKLEAKLETGLTQLQIKLMTWTAVLAGIIIAVLKLT